MSCQTEGIQKGENVKSQAQVEVAKEIQANCKRYLGHVNNKQEVDTL